MKPMSEASKAPKNPVTPSDPIQILHVDDDEPFLNLSKQCLELQTDIQVDSASCVQEALERMKNKKFDVIVSDYEMFEKDGLQFLQELRSTGNETPFILFTGKGHEEELIKALNLGAFRFMNKNGTPNAVFSELATCIRQASDNANAHEKLGKTEKRFQTVLDSSIDAIVITDDDGNIVYSNKAAQEMFQYAQKQIADALREHFSKQFTRAYEQSMHEGFVTSSEGNLSMKGKTVELTLNLATDEPQIVELSFSAFEENDRWYGVSIIRDISECEKHARYVEESKQRFAALFSQNPGAIVFVDTDFLVTDINESFTALFGYKIEDIKGRSIMDLVVPKGLDEELEIIREKIVEGPVGCSTTRMRADGSVFNTAMTGGPLVVRGKTVGFFMVYLDISDFVTVQEELSKALTKAEQLNEKIAVLGGFTRHDIRNKLTLIQCNIYLARQKSSVNPEVEKCLKNIEGVINNITTILDSARTYEQIGSEELTICDVGNAVQSAISLFSNLRNVKIDNKCVGFETVADSLLTQVFHNLIDDSLKYGGEKLTEIKIYFEETDECILKLIYEDDGVGIDENAKAHLFQKGFGKGTGLGLYLISKICEVYGWTVKETGHCGSGVKFEFTLPTKKQSPNS